VKRIPVQKVKSAVAGQSTIKAGRAQRGTQLRRFSIPLLFFSCYFIFLVRSIDPAVIFSSSGMNIHSYVAAMHAQDASPQDTSSSYADPWFRHLFILELTPEYLREIAGAPGGWAKLAVTLHIYACRYPIAGALAVTGLALFFYWIFALYIQGTGARRPFVLRFVPAFFILTICAWYELRYCSFLLPVAGALAFAVFYRRLRPAAVLTTVLWLSVLFWFAWYLMQWGSLLVLLFIVINELFSKERRIASVATTAAVNGALLFIIDAWFIPLDMTIRWSDFTALSGLPLAVIAFFPLAAIILAELSRFRRAPEAKTATIPIIRMSLFVCGTVAAAVWLCREPVNRDTRTIARTVYHVMNGQWEAVLNEKTASLFADFPQRGGALQIFMVHAVDHALCRTGLLGDRLLDFPQAMFSYDPLLMLQSTQISGYVNLVVALDLAMDLGLVNAAEKIAGEIMEKMGPYPDIIYRRALVQIAKDNRDAAAVYLGKLACMPFYRPEAKRLLGMLDNSHALLSEPRIAAMCAKMDTVDYFLFNNAGNDVILKRLLQSNPGNKTAYDYLMTYDLLDHRLDEVAALLPAAPSFGYTVLPRPWEEALCLYQSVNSLQASSEISFTGLRQETIERFYRFSQAWLPIKDDPKAAAKLAPAFGDSYFYFSIFRYCRGAFHE
jgi:hypothetical protein